MTLVGAKLKIAIWDGDKSPKQVITVSIHHKILKVKIWKEKKEVMNGENRSLVTNEPVEFKKWLAEVHRLW